ncbi:MAG TPA: DUF1579 family protein [Pyrinomonadaceae bacterium]|nr:DUF1579 family protein [Pyrinomonadaceae bacterium]
MTIQDVFSSLVGEWKGTNRLNLSFLPDPIFESPSTAKAIKRMNGQCLEIAYTWVYEGEQHEGVILITGSGKDNSVSAFWTDSWHSKYVLMECKGTISDEGVLNMMGHYTVPGHPAWGWRTEIVPGEESFKYLMFNVSPEGEEDWAVETVFERA